MMIAVSFLGIFPGCGSTQKPKIEQGKINVQINPNLEVRYLRQNRGLE
jgi:hypothetical protein